MEKGKRHRTANQDCLSLVVSDNFQIKFQKSRKGKPDT